MIHQPLGGAEGQAADIEIQAREIINLREITNNLLAKHTGQPLEKISRDVDRNFWMNAEEAKKYGLIDEIFYQRS
jgi:ATP-dependent Clp protease protease subunit